MSATIRNGKRFYNVWAGNPQGLAEDFTRCVEECSYPGRFIMYHQCARKRGYGPDSLYCKQHAKKIADREAWQAKLKEHGVL